MLQLTLLPSLALPALAPFPPSLPSVDELSRGLPADTFGVVLFGDLHAACTGEDAGQWGRMLADKRWMDVIVNAIAMEEGSNPEEVRQGLELALATMSGTQGGALALLDETTGSFAAVMRVEEGWLDTALARSAELGAKFEPVDALGRKAYRSADGGPLTALLVPDGANVVFANGADLAAATAAVEGIFSGLAAGDDAERWWLQHAGRVADAEVEVFIDGTPLMATAPAEFSEAMGDLELMYMALDLGSENHSEALMQIAVGGGPVMEVLASSVVPAEVGLLAHVPVGHTGTVFGLDLEQVIAGALEFASQQNPDAEAQYEQGLEAVNGMLGIDFEADFLAHLTGQLLFVQPPTDLSAVLAAEDESELPVDSLIPAFGFQIDDNDAVLGVVEALIGVAEGQGLVFESAEVEGCSLWSVDPGMGTNIGVAVGRGFLTIGTESSVTALLGALAKPDQEHAVSKATIAALDAELDGALITISPAAAVLDSLDSVVSMVEELAAMESDPAAELAVEFISAINEISHDYISGVMAGELDLTAKGVVYRMFTR